MNVDQLFEDFEKGFPKRKFSAGLLIAFIDFLKDLKIPGQKFTSLDDMLVKYPRQQTTAAGQHANVLIVARGGNAGTVSLRPFYNEAERFFGPIKSVSIIQTAPLTLPRHGPITAVGLILS